MDALKYEDFMRRAFGLALNDGIMIERWGDPAKWADTDVFEYENINKVKAGLIYAIGIICSEVKEHKCDALCDEYINNIAKAKSKTDILQIIKSFDDHVGKMYFEIRDGRMYLKQPKLET
ncbi:MAG: hypothetical protein HQL55_10755 [Magnetococcales bacterium]|nr:hypothetical protein [Magnetococcales bacterium]